MIEICKGILIGNSFLYQGQILAVEGKNHVRPNLSKYKKKKKKNGGCTRLLIRCYILLTVFSFW
jgi:hypothetical protein